MKKKNILIIGGGPAGLEAAGQLQKYGHNVILIEKCKALGGHLSKWDRLFPDGVEALSVLNKMLAALGNVKCFTETEVLSINMLDKSYNVILSNGISVLADAVLLSSGFDLFNAEKKEEYGYGVYDRVISNADLERYFKSREDRRIEKPKRIGFVHCVGSRDEKAGCRACSKVCCATAVKQACEIKEVFPDAQVFCFYMDLRMFGKNYEDMYLKAQKEYGVRFIRGRVSEVAEQYDKSLIVKAEDTLSSKPLKVTLDLLVLMSGMRPAVGTDTVAGLLRLMKDDDGFVNSKDGIYEAQKSPRPGLFLAGAVTGPKTLPETLSEARSAALGMLDYLNALG